MKLDQELRLRQGFQSIAHEALLSIHHTGIRIRRRADEFMREHGVTDVQFNVLTLLLYQGGEEGGLTQIELSRMMLVNRANITSLIDRMERDGLVKRTAVPGDRRSNMIRLTAKGRKVLQSVEDAYYGEVERIMGVMSQTDQRRLVKLLERVRDSIREGK